MARSTFDVWAWRRLLMVAMPVALLLLGGCTPLVRQRTLPPSIRAVHVPMILNRTSQPGLEERLTAAVQTEVLADGRLRLVKRREADAIVMIELTDFDRVGFTFDGDEFPTTQLFRVEATLEIRENIPGTPLIGGRRRLVVEQPYDADTRSIAYNALPDSLEFFYEGFGRQVVQELLTGDYSGVNDDRGDDQPEAPAPAVLVPGR
ncbi:hypothetical protein GC173_12905 [bacterium]|nr:hypothetical protein [bacterium]